MTSAETFGISSCCRPAETSQLKFRLPHTVSASSSTTPLIAACADATTGSKPENDVPHWRTDFPSTVIDDRPVDVVQGTQADNTPAKFYFDKETGLLLRLVRYTNTRIGFNPTQIDYADYRTVSGVEMPFKLTVTWTDGRSVIELSEMQANAPVDAARFARPAPPAR